MDERGIMRGCPVCRATYSNREDRCRRDGAELVDMPSREPTASVIASAPKRQVAVETTSQESPAARRERPSRSKSQNSDKNARRREKSKRREKSGEKRGSGERRKRRPDSHRKHSDSSRNNSEDKRRRNQKESARARVGQRLGSYELLGVLGQGGMGTVYRAEHVRLGREVALKLLLDDYTKSREAVARFFREARAVNKIRHKNIVDVTDLVELEDGSSFIIMELLHGKPLSRVIRKERLTVGRALRLMLQICDGLAAAHSVDIVHRDLKPDNIFICTAPDGSDLVKLLDFGVAKLLSDDPNELQQHRTAAGAVVGTPAFMSPEQAGSLRVDSRSDIYALGAILYDMFVGRPPFRADSFGEYVRKHLDERPIPPSEASGSTAISVELENLILRCLEKKPAMRYQSAGELREALQEILSNRKPSSPARAPRASSSQRHHSQPFTPAPGNTTNPSPSDSAPYFLESSERKPAKNRAGWVVLLTLLLAGVAGAGVYFGVRAGVGFQSTEKTDVTPVAPPTTTTSDTPQ